MREEFDFDAALAALQDGQSLTGKDGILTNPSRVSRAFSLLAFFIS